MTVGSNIKKARKNIKQADLAERLGVDTSTISRWENDKNVPGAAMLKKIAEVLGTSTSVLLSENDAGLQNNENKNASSHSQISAMQNGDVLFFKDGEHEVSVPDTEENRHEFWKIVKQIFSGTSQIGVSINNGQKNKYNVSDITVKN